LLNVKSFPDRKLAWRVGGMHITAPNLATIRTSRVIANGAPVAPLKHPLKTLRIVGGIVALQWEKAFVLITVARDHVPIPRNTTMQLLLQR